MAARDSKDCKKQAWISPYTDHQPVLFAEQSLRAELRQMASRQHDDAMQEACFRRAHEESLTRFRFEPRSLNDSEQSAWREYLAFAESSMCARRCRRVYQRCLVACSMHADFWVLCATYLERHEGAEAARRLLWEGSLGPFKRRPHLRSELAMLDEQCGRIEEARAGHMEIVERLAPGQIEHVLRWADFERRSGEGGAKRSWAAYEWGMKSMRERGDVRCEIVIAMRYATQRGVCGDWEGAKQVLSLAMRDYPWSRMLVQCRASLELSCGGGVEGARAVYERAVSESGGLSVRDRLAVCTDWASFEGERGGDVSRQRRAEAGKRELRRLVAKEEQSAQLEESSVTADDYAFVRGEAAGESFRAGEGMSSKRMRIHAYPGGDGGSDLVCGAGLECKRF
jgi:hypothetical protein